MQCHDEGIVISLYEVQMMKKLLIAFNIIVVAIALGFTLMNGCTPADDSVSGSNSKLESAEHQVEQPGEIKK